MASSYGTRMPMRASPVAPQRPGAMSQSSPLRPGLEPLMRTLPRAPRCKSDEDLSFLKPLISSATATGDELQSPESLQQSVTNGARFVIQHLPPLEGLPSLAPRAPAPMESDELPDLAAAAVTLETAHDSTLKPHISLPGLIAMAILDSPAKRLTVGEIYDWIKTRYPYYATAAAGVGWKNSVRHNLSLSRHFMKKAREDESGEMAGKGAYWCLRPESYLHCEAAIVKQAKVYQRMGGGLADIAGLSVMSASGHAAMAETDERRRPGMPRGRRPDMRELSSSDAAATLMSLTNAALPAVKGQAGARSRSVTVRTGGSAGHSATLRYYPDSASRRQADGLGATPPIAGRAPAAARAAEAEDQSPTPGPDEGIGATPDMSPRKRSNSGTLYTFASTVTQLDGSVRGVPDGRRSPPHARRRLTLRDSVHEEGTAAHSDALAATAALMSLAALAADTPAMPPPPAQAAAVVPQCASSSPLAQHVSTTASLSFTHSPGTSASALSPVPEVHIAPSPPAPESSSL